MPPRTLLAAPALALLAACESAPAALLPARVDEAKTDLARMRADPRTLPRPVVILSGWADPGFCVARLAGDLRQVAPQAQMLDLAFITQWDFPACRRKVVQAVEAAWPGAGDGETIEVDVIAHSMGGVVARYAALPAGAAGFPDGAAPAGPRLKVARLFTIGSPHQGANLAPLWPLDPKVRAMRPGSDFLAALDAAAGDRPRIVPYAIEYDWVVGAAHAAPAGMDCRTIPWRPGWFSHVGAPFDPRLQSDIFRQLRGEPDWRTAKAAPAHTAQGASLHDLP